MPTLANRPEFQPNVGMMGASNRGPSPAPQFQPNVGMFGAPNRGAATFSPFDQSVARPFPNKLASQPGAQGAGVSGGHEFCPTCGQSTGQNIGETPQSSPLQGLTPNINTAGRQAPLAQPVSQNTGGRGTPGKSFGGSLGRF